MTEHHQWHIDTLAEKVVQNLIKHSFKAVYFRTAEEASAYIAKSFSPGLKVAFGGSLTARQLGLREHAAKAGAELIDHGIAGITEQERLEIMRRELSSDLFISSTNALTIEGSLVNADGYGNRVAAMIFGPKKVIIVAGINKIVADEEAAFVRIKNLAAPINMKRLNRNTPCTVDGLCHDCNSSDRGCRAYTILRRRPQHTPSEVIIIGENLGM